MADSYEWTILLGDKPLDLAPPVSYKRDIQTEHIEDILPNGRVWQADRVIADGYLIFSGTRLAAYAPTLSLTKDHETGRMTLRLPEKGTVIY